MTIVVSFEGLPKAGKTTISSLVYEYYKIKGYAVLKYTDTYFSEPGIIALKYAEKEEKRPLSTSFLFASALLYSYEEILNRIASYDLIVVDNFFSYYLLYITLNNVNVPVIEEFLLKLTLPQIVIYLDVNYDVAAKRVKPNETLRFSEVLKSKEIFEKVKAQVRAKLAKRFPYKVVTIPNNTEEMFETLKKIKPIIDAALKEI